MKPKILSSRIKLLMAQTLIGCMPLLLPGTLHAQTDNFDSATDAAWSKLISAGYPATYSFTPDGYGGYAYRLQGAATLTGGPGRAIAYRSDRLYTNFFVAVDIIDWDNSTNNDQVFGLIARAQNIDTGLKAATFTTRINRFSSDGINKGQVQVYSFFFGGVGAPSSQNFGSTLLPGHRYRFVFTGVGPKLSAAIYDLQDLTYPLVSMSGDTTGGGFPDYGYVGIFNVSLASGTKDPTTDTTFDNFVAMELPPDLVGPPATPHGFVGFPQVVSRSPASFANFYAGNTISFHATTLTTTNTIDPNSLRLFLNGVNVSASLSLSGPATNVLVSYSGLTSNAVYDARIEFQDIFGRHATNAFTFDTFTDSYLDTVPFGTIECEDFNYVSAEGDGLFMDAPLPSGLTTNGAPVNISGGGYYGLDAINATFGGLDFYTADTSVDPSWSEFRPTSIQTLQGNRNYGYYSNGIIVYDRTYDTQRQKYSNADPALEEYEVVRTRGGLWLNYTRTFPTNTSYNVYLRHACALSEDLSLDQITDAATNNLGTFSATNALGINNYRYAPLRETSGKLAIVHLEGTNTVRLTVLGQDFSATRYGLSLAYLAFVPALLVESAASLEGPFAIEPAANVEPGTRQISVPSNGNTRFYRLRWDRAVRVTRISLNAGNVLMTYE